MTDPMKGQISMALAHLATLDVPELLQGGLARYLEHGCPPGSFLRAVLSNDMRGALLKGDQDSLHSLRGIVTWLHNAAPEGCWGSEAAMTTWCEARRALAEGAE